VDRGGLLQFRLEQLPNCREEEDVRSREHVDVLRVAAEETPDSSSSSVLATKLSMEVAHVNDSECPVCPRRRLAGEVGRV